MLSVEIKKVFEGGQLTKAESQEVIAKVATGKVAEVEIAVLLTLLSTRESSVQELVGLAEGMRSHTLAVGKVDFPLLDTCGTGGDGRHTFNVSTLSAIVIAALGVKVAKHGNRSITSKCGSADLLEGLGVKIDIPIEKITPCLKDVGIAFFFAPHFHPVMKILGPIRKQIGIPTLFNSMGPLLSPIRAEYQVMGLYYQGTEKMAQVLQALGVKGGMVVHSHEGMDEVSPVGPTRITEFTSENSNTYDFDPTSYGFPRDSEAEIQGGDVEMNVGIAREVLDPSVSLNPRKRFVILNAATGVRVVKGWDYREALEAVEETLQSGTAQSKLQEWVEWTHQASQS